MYVLQMTDKIFSDNPREVLCFSSATTIGQLLYILPNEIKVTKGIIERQKEGEG